MYIYMYIYIAAANIYISYHKIILVFSNFSIFAALRRLCGKPMVSHLENGLQMAWWIFHIDVNVCRRVPPKFHSIIFINHHFLGSWWVFQNIP